MSVTASAGELASLPPDEWLDRVACTPDIAELFHPTGTGVQADTALAVAICGGCPVKQDCLDWAVDRRIEHGIWGGLLPKERRRIVRKRIGRAKIDETRTHCPAKHPYTKANTYRTPEGFRRCRACANERRRKERLARRLVAVPA